MAGDMIWIAQPAITVIARLAARANGRARAPLRTHPARAFLINHVCFIATRSPKCEYNGAVARLQLLRT